MKSYKDILISRDVNKIYTSIVLNVDSEPLHEILEEVSDPLYLNLVDPITSLILKGDIR